MSHSMIRASRTTSVSTVFACTSHRWRNGSHYWRPRQPMVPCVALRSQVSIAILHRRSTFLPCPVSRGEQIVGDPTITASLLLLRLLNHNSLHNTVTIQPTGGNPPRHTPKIIRPEVTGFDRSMNNRLSNPGRRRYRRVTISPPPTPITSIADDQFDESALTHNDQNLHMAADHVKSLSMMATENDQLAQMHRVCEEAYTQGSLYDGRMSQGEGRAHPMWPKYERIRVCFHWGVARAWPKCRLCGERVLGRGCW